jgi:anti-anti-sigma regulatory factor
MTRAQWHPGHGGHRGSLRSPDPDLDDAEVVVELEDGDAADTLRALRRRLPMLLDRSPSTVIVDLSDTARPSSATVAALLWLERRCRSRSVVVVLRKPSRRSASMLRRTGLQSALPIEGPDSPRHGRSVAPGRDGGPAR